MNDLKKPVSSAQISAMRPGDKDLSDIGENRGLRVHCGAGGIKSFYYRYSSPIHGNLVQIQIGHFPTLSLAQARLELQKLKLARKQGRCPANEQKEKLRQRELEVAAEKPPMTVKDMIDHYLVNHDVFFVGTIGSFLLSTRE